MKKSFLFGLRCDLREGILRQYPRFLVVTLAFAFLALRDCLNLPKAAEAYELSQSVPTLADCWCLHFGGMMYPVISLPPMIDYIWIVGYLYLAVFIAYYPFRDLQGFGRQIILHSRRITLWWFGKCVWTAAAILAYCVSACIGMAAVTAAFGGFCFEPNLESIYVLNPIRIEKVFTAGDLLNHALLLPVILLAVYLLELFISLLTKPIFGIMSTALILIGTMFSASPYFPFQGMMFIRTDAVLLENGANTGYCAAVCCAVSAALIAAGAFYMKRKDLL